MNRNLLILATLGAALALQPVATLAKPKECFTAAEESAERIVRYGLELREGARMCSAPPYNLNLMGLWDNVDKQVGPRFAQQKAIREKAFRREFGNDAVNRLEMWNGRVVLYYRNYSASPVFCAGIEKNLKTVQQKGWSAVTRSAGKSKDGVKMDFRPCP